MVRWKQWHRGALRAARTESRAQCVGCDLEMSRALPPAARQNSVAAQPGTGPDRSGNAALGSLFLSVFEREVDIAGRQIAAIGTHRNALMVGADLFVLLHDLALLCGFALHARRADGG